MNPGRLGCYKVMICTISEENGFMEQYAGDKIEMNTWSHNGDWQLLLYQYQAMGTKTRLCSLGRLYTEGTGRRF